MTNKEEKKKEMFLRQLLGLWNEYTEALVNAEKEGKGHYTDADFTFDNFMRYLRVNYFE